MEFARHILQGAILGGAMTESTISKNVIIKNTNNSYCIKSVPN